MPETRTPEILRCQKPGPDFEHSELSLVSSDDVVPPPSSGSPDNFSMLIFSGYASRWPFSGGATDWWSESNAATRREAQLHRGRWSV